MNEVELPQQTLHDFPLQDHSEPEPSSWFQRYGQPSDAELAHYRATRRLARGAHGSRLRWVTNSAGNSDVSSCERPLTYDALIDSEYLGRQFFHLRSQLGSAAGVDGVTPSPLTRTEVGKGFRAIVQAIKDGTWHPAPRRHKRIRKSCGGWRTLSIQNVLERVLSKVINRSLLNQIDQTLPNAFYGFRPRRSVQSLLARLHTLCGHWGSLYLAQADIRTAFDNVPVTEAISAVSEQVADCALVDVISKIARGPNCRLTGIAQGDPLSPTILLLIMSKYLDWSDSGPANRETLCRLAYADNLLYASTTAPIGSRALILHEEQLSALNMSLKEERSSPLDVRRQGAKFDTLGFRLSLPAHGILGIQVAPTGWRNLQESLNEAHRSTNPPMVAKLSIHSWIESYAPAFGTANADQQMERIKRIALRSRIRELVDSEMLIELARRSHERWRRLCVTSID